MTIHKFALLPIILLSSLVRAQEASFQTFLSEHERKESFDSTSFDSPYKFIEQESRYAEFLPPTNEECRCKPENVRWTKGSYVKYKNFIAVTLQRYCMNYQDGNEQWFIENDGDDYMLITYSLDGKMLDYKTVGHYGAAYPIRVTSSDNGLSLVVQQKVLDDCSLLHQYKNLTYTVCTRKYTLKSNGKIKEQCIEAPHKEVVDVMSSVKQFSFDQFLSYFQKWDKPYVDHTLFTPPSEREKLPFASCLSLIPDTLDHNCWPRDTRWIPCQYIEAENVFRFFLIKDCAIPKMGFVPYTDHLILEFHKNGTYKSAKNVYHSDDDSFVNMETTQALITKALIDLDISITKPMPTKEDIETAARSILNTVANNHITQTPEVLTTAFQKLQKHVGQVEDKYGYGEPLAPWPEWGLDVDYREFKIIKTSIEDNSSALITIKHSNEWGTYTFSLILRKENNKWLVDDYIYYDDDGTSHSSRVKYENFIAKYEGRSAD